METMRGKTVILVGHDPSLYLFANCWVGYQIFTGGMDKSGMVVIRFDGVVGQGKGQLVEYLNPNLLSNQSSYIDPNGAG